MAAVLRREGWAVNRKRAKRLMRVMAADGDEGDLPETQHQQGPSGSQGLSIFVARSDNRPPEPGVVRGHHIYSKGFVYLVAVMDWFSRRVLAWRLMTQTGSNQSDTGTGHVSMSKRAGMTWAESS
jgi:putative transposase